MISMYRWYKNINYQALEFFSGILFYGISDSSIGVADSTPHGEPRTHTLVPHLWLTYIYKTINEKYKIRNIQA